MTSRSRYWLSRLPCGAPSPKCGSSSHVTGGSSSPPLLLSLLQRCVPFFFFSWDVIWVVPIWCYWKMRLKFGAFVIWDVFSGYGDFDTAFLDGVDLLGAGCGDCGFPSECASFGSVLCNCGNMQVKILYGLISLFYFC